MRPKHKGEGAPLLVLMFHGVVERIPPWATYPGTRSYQLRADDFSRVVDSCMRRYRIARLADIPRYLHGEAEEPGILLTFDDGLASVCETAVPILRRHGATATLFVTTSWVDAGEAPAIFELEQKLWSSAPVRLEVQCRDFTFEADVASRAACGAIISRLWSELFSRRFAPLSLKRDHFRFGGQPWRLVAEAAVTGLWHPATWDSLRSAVREGALEIGAHGATHVPWPWVAGSDLEGEVAGARKRLEAEFDCAVEACAYPHGMSDPATRSQAEKSFRWAFGTEPVRAAPGWDMTNLPRYHVPSERPNSMSYVVIAPLIGRILRRGARYLGVS